MKKMRWLVVLATVAGVAVGIYLFTGSPLSGDAFTQGLLRNLGFSEATIEVLETILRKGAHMIEFGLAAVIIWYILPIRSWSYPVAWLCATVLGMADEIHQMYLLGRTALFSDVVLDSLGALLALLVLYRIKKR